jgi:zinc D-Ala-D-Ala dipeptidase
MCATPPVATLAAAVASLVVACGPPPAPVPSPYVTPVPGDTRQLIVVVTPGWDSVSGSLYRFERRDARAEWRSAAPPVAVVVGRSGLAWGRGLYDASREKGPAKREGDAKSPAGVFRLGTAFGFDSMQPRMPYVQLTATSECVDDPASTHYNTLIDRGSVSHVDWTSGERMRDEDPFYRLGVFVQHNSMPATPGAGSCIFLHVWGGPTTPTTGCTALDESRLREVVAWLASDAQPVLVELPLPEYTSHHAAWGLPALL